MIKPYYEHEGIVIYHSDARDVIPELPQIELVITDPPYCSGARRDADRAVRGSMLRSMEDADWFSHDAMTTWGFQWFLRSVMAQLRSKLKHGAHLYLFSDWRQTPNVYGLLESCGYRVNHCLVWAKTHYGMGVYWRNQHEHIVFASNGMPDPMLDHGMGSVLTWPNVRSEKRSHPTEKPVGLIEKIVCAVPGSVILDPFMGTGATLVAAKHLSRRAIGIEIEERFCGIAAKRLTETPERSA